MNEDLITFETAKLAKKKGFNLVVRFWYEDFDDNRLFEPFAPDNYNNEEVYKGTFSAPPQSLLQKWLREEHEIFVWCELNSTKKWNVIIDDLNPSGDVYVENIQTYKRALEKGLFIALGLIKKL